MLLGKRQQINIVPGVNPLTDSTELDTIYFTAADKVRFQGGKLRKLKGWQRIFPVNNINVSGYCRNIFSYRDQFGDPIEIFGTNTRLYAYTPENGDFFFNITPLQTTTNPIPNSLSTEYNAAVPVQLQTTAGSPVVTLSIDNAFEDNEPITISNVVGGPFGGIPAAALQGSFPVFVINNSQVQFTVPATATTTGVFEVTLTWASDYLYVNYPSNGLTLGDRIKIQGSTDVDGILAAAINKEFIISNIVDGNNFAIMTGTTATSSVTAGGGAGVTIQLPIAAGAIDQNEGFGFGGNQYGLGVFGVGQPNTSNVVSYPRIWSMDNFGNYLILTPGDPATSSTDNLYYWSNDISVAPVLVSSSAGASNVPLAVRWVYVSNNTVVALGAGGVLNKFQSSDVASFNNWTPGASTYAYSTVLQNASAIISQSKARNFDLLFTQNEVYQIEFVDKPDIWFFRKLFGTDGIIGPKARAVVEDAVFWMGNGDFYVFDGYTVTVLPNNTLKRYVYDNINFGQSSKCFVYANVEYNEISFFYPNQQDTECNNYVTDNYKEYHWTTGTMSRSAAEERTNALGNPLLTQSGNFINVPVPDSIGTIYLNLPNNPLTTSSGSNQVTISGNPTFYLEVGDQIQISGATATGGITAPNLNGVRTITSVTGENAGYGSGQFGAGQYGADIVGITFTAGANATSSTTGGGNNAVIASSMVGLLYSGASTLSAGDMITVTGSTAVGGLSAGIINTTAVIRYIDGNIIQYYTAGANTYPTSSQIFAGGPAIRLSYLDDCRVFKHDTGYDDYNNNFNVYTDPFNEQFAPMFSYAQTNYLQLGDGDTTMLLYSLYPDINQTGNMTVVINMKEFAQSPYVHTQLFTTTPTTTKIDPMMIGRERQYIFTSNVLEGNFLMGKLYEEIKSSTPR
jgi:hypothetical protein